MPSDSNRSDYDYELVIIGGGSGGLSAAKRAAQFGKRVAIAEKNHLGGTCVNRGCIPTKLMIYAAEFAQQRRTTQAYGWSVDESTSFDWGRFQQSMNSHIAQLRETKSESLEGIDLLRGQASFLDAHTIAIEGREITAEFVLIAVGSRPQRPSNIEGIEHALDSRDVLNLAALPQSVVIIGGGYIGVELAQVLCYYGCEVTVVESQPCILDGFDTDLQRRAKQVLEADGITVINGARLEKIEKIEKGERGLTAILQAGKTVRADQVVIALGRAANIDTLNLDALGVTTKNGKIVVDKHKRTQEKNVFAIGDCIDTMMLTPVAIAEGKAAVDAMFRDPAIDDTADDTAGEINYRWVPSAVFLHPEIATVGPTEQEATDQGERFEVVSHVFTPLRDALVAEPLEAMIKLLVRPDKGEILAVHMIVPRAADLVQMLVPALKKGLTVDELREIIPIHPSTGEEIFSL